MTNLHLFLTQSAHDAVYNGGEYVEPWVGYIDGTSNVTYNKDLRNVVGSIAYFDGSKVKFVSKESWSSSLGTPIGVVVIPASHMTDGKCRVVSLCNMSYVTPETGTLLTDNDAANNGGTKLLWGSFGNTQLLDFGNVQTLSGMSSNAYLSCDFYTSNDGYHLSVTDDDEKCPPLYLADGSRNPLCDTPNLALADMNGKANTDFLVGLSAIKDTYVNGKNAAFDNSYDNYPAAFACSLFKTEGTNQGDWYLPACGELAYMVVRRNAINTTIEALGNLAVKVIDASESFGSWCWSSSEVSSLDVRIIYASGRVYFTDKGFPSNYLRVRAFTAL